MEAVTPSHHWQSLYSMEYSTQTLQGRIHRMKLQDNVLCKSYSINVTTYTGKTTFKEVELAVYTSSEIFNESHHDNEFE